MTADERDLLLKTAIFVFELATRKELGTPKELEYLRLALERVGAKPVCSKELFPKGTRVIWDSHKANEECWWDPRSKDRFLVAVIVDGRMNCNEHVMIELVDLSGRPHTYTSPDNLFVKAKIDSEK